MMVIKNGESAVENVVIGPSELQVYTEKQMDGKKKEFVETCCKKVTDRLFPRQVSGSEVSENYPFSLKYLRRLLLARPESRL